MSCSTLFVIFVIAYVISMGPVVYLALRRIAQESELDRLLSEKNEIPLNPGFNELGRTKYEFLKMKIINHPACWTTLWKTLNY